VGSFGFKELSFDVGTFKYDPETVLVGILNIPILKFKKFAISNSN